MGEFLQQMPMNPGMAGNAGPGRGNAVPMQNRVSPEPTLAEIGITKKQSFQAQRRAVEVALRELGGMSDPQIAAVCAVTQPFVLKVRTQGITIIPSCGKSPWAGGNRYHLKRQAPRR